MFNFCCCGEIPRTLWNFRLRVCCSGWLLFSQCKTLPVLGFPAPPVYPHKSVLPQGCSIRNWDRQRPKASSNAEDKQLLEGHMAVNKFRCQLDVMLAQQVTAGNKSRQSHDTDRQVWQATFVTFCVRQPTPIHNPILHSHDSVILSYIIRCKPCEKYGTWLIERTRRNTLWGGMDSGQELSSCWLPGPNGVIMRRNFITLKTFDKATRTTSC